MEKDEILAKAQQENKGGDLADVEAQKKGAMVAYIVGICAMILVSFITFWVTGIFHYGPMGVVCLMTMIAFFIKYFSLRKKHELIVAICYAACTAVFLTLWILQLCKVI